MTIKSLLLLALIAACSADAVGMVPPDLDAFVQFPRYPTIFGILAIGTIFWAVYNVVVYPRYLSPLRHLPGPKHGSLWNGHAKRLFSEPIGWPSTEWLLNTPNNGLIRYLGLLNSERIMVTSAKGLAELTARTYDFPKPKFISQLAGQILGPGLVLVDGDEHRRQRKMLAPAFTSKNVRELYPVFWAKSRELTDHLTCAFTNPSVEGVTREKCSDTIQLDVSDWVSRAALDVITLAALGEDWGSIANPNTPLCQTYHSIFQLGQFATIMALVKTFVPEWIVKRLPFAQNSVMHDASQTIMGTCRKVVLEKKQKLALDKLTDVDLLSVLLRGGEIKEDEAVYQMMTFLAAGHETLATAVTWAIYMLCVHPEWQTILREEVRSKLPSPSQEESVSNQDIDSLVQLTAFCNETLRWWPPIPSTLRTTAHDTTLLGQPIPKGTRIVVPMRGTNRNPEIWGKDAGSFVPERWIHDGQKIDASGGASSKYGMLTFMHGVRNCVGQSFAKGEMACILAVLIGRFEFELRDATELIESNLKISRGGVTARPLNGLWVSMRIVEGW